MNASEEMFLLLALGFLFLILWSTFWKGLALWHTAGRNQPWWFVIFLFLNTAGILELIYLFGVAKLRFKDLFTLHTRTPAAAVESAPTQPGS